MTGFSSAELELERFRLIMELRSLNSKVSDINLRIPPFLGNQESYCRKIIAEKLYRGKIDLVIKSIPINQPNQKINVELVKGYMDELRQIYRDCSMETLMSLAVKMPEVWIRDSAVIREDENDKFKSALADLIDNLHNYRIQEGEILMKVLKDSIKLIDSLLITTEKKAHERETNKEIRLKKIIKQAGKEYDEKRMEEEILYYLEKLDVSEEIVRLKSHLDYFQKILLTNPPNGKKLGFISQEIGRELNTLGAKIQDAPIQRLVVCMKDELEKIKEQLFNIV
ncbi:MAG: DUF1732 domain-containing protein [Flavobacteriaceae bacterium]|nr:DUF1732 domain-containing protein [Flavobacteriaceae bacterium]